MLDPATAGILVTVLLFVALAAGVHIGVALGLAGILGMYLAIGPDAALLPTTVRGAALPAARTRPLVDLLRSSVLGPSACLILTTPDFPLVSAAEAAETAWVAAALTAGAADAA